MEEKNNQHTTSHYSCNITKIVKNLRVQLNYKYYHKLKRRLKTFKISFLLNTQNHVSRVSKNKAHIFIAKMMLNLPTISWNSGLIQICCSHPENWFNSHMVTVTLVYRNIHVATWAINYIKSRPGVWVLAWGKRGKKVSYITSKTCKYRI